MQKLYDFILSAFGRKARSCFSHSEIVILASDILRNYRKKGSLLLGLDASLYSSPKYIPFSRLARSIKLGHFPEIESSSKLNQSTLTLYNILVVGLTQSTSVENNLENFCNDVRKGIEERNKIKSKTDGMNIISLLGVILFFPLFSGITAGITLSSGGLLSSQKLLSDEIRALCMGYVFTILSIKNYFSNPLNNLATAIKSSAPLLIISYFFQSAAFYFASYAI